MNKSIFMNLTPLRGKGVGWRNEFLKFCILQAPESGLILEFGVHQGRTIKLISNIVPTRTVYGFDSFNGLPEKWIMGERSVLDKGQFATAIPVVPKNVILIKGLFQDTLEKWYLEHCDPIAFIHMDCDLYSSTLHVLSTLNDGIQPGTIIVFDELCDWEDNNYYQNWKEGEWKALEEWTKSYNRQIEPIARTQDIAGSIKIIK